MQKTIKTMLALMAGAMALSACSNEVIFNNEKNQSEGNMTFTATVSDEEGEATRASLKGLKIVWNQGDEISVFSGAALTTNNKMTLTSGAGTISASFTGNCTKGQQYFAIYPYNAEHSAKDYNNLGCKIVWNCAEQTAVNGSFDPSVPMIAKASGVSETATSVPLQFRNIYAFVKVTTDYKCKSITLTSHAGSIASIFRYVSFDNEGNPNPTYESSTQSNVISLKGKDGANIEAGTYYIAVHPTTLSNGFELTFTSVYDETKKYTKSTSKNVTFTAGKVLNLGSVTLRGTDVETLEGAGTSENPYKINDFDDLKTFQRWITAEKGETWKKFYLQTADIDAQGQEMAPIGTAAHRFWGTYDGGNHYIKNLCIKGTIGYTVPTSVTSETNRATALFGAIRGATIKNLTIENPSFHQDNKGEKLTVSPFVGIAYSADESYSSNRCKILNCKLTGSCTINNICNSGESHPSLHYGLIYGGFVGCSQCNLEISDCTTDMGFQASYSVNDASPLAVAVGGFVGLSFGVNVKNDGDLERDGEVKINRCRNNSPLFKFVDNEYLTTIGIGGFIGVLSDLTTDDDVACAISNCVNNASIEYNGVNDLIYFGGFVGDNDSDGYGDTDPTVKNCVNNGNLKCQSTSSDYHRYVGGIIGMNPDDDTKFTNCANTGTLESNQTSISYIGAISGVNGTFNECWYCNSNYPICSESAGDMTNCGKKTIDEVVTRMNATALVKNNSNFYSWKKSVFNGRDVLDLDF